MTCREKLKIEQPEKVDAGRIGGCVGCPYDYGYLTRPEYCNCGITESLCIKCWDREIHDISKNEGDVCMYIEQKIEKVTINNNNNFECREQSKELDVENEVLKGSFKSGNEDGTYWDKEAMNYRMKYVALKNQGFTEDQAMSLLPIWTDD